MPLKADYMAHSTLLQLGQSWVSQQTGVEQTGIEIVPPDSRVKIPTCTNSIEFNFPFSKNKRTISATCNSPKWRYFFSVRLEPTTQGVVAARNLDAGTVIQKNDLKITTVKLADAEQLPSLTSLVGKITTQDIQRLEVIRDDDVTSPIQRFKAQRAYEHSEPIPIADLAIDLSSEQNPADNLIEPESKFFLAKKRIEPKEYLTKSNVEPAEFVASTTRAIPIGKIITEQDLVLTLRPSKQITAAPIRDLSEAIGMETLKNLPPSQIILKADLQVAKLVMQDESVTLVVKKGNLMITSRMRALEDGKLGDVISLLNEESGKVIKATVIARSRVKPL